MLSGNYFTQCAEVDLLGIFVEEEVKQFMDERNVTIFWIWLWNCVGMAINEWGNILLRNSWTDNKPIKHHAVAILKPSENSLGEHTSRKKFFFSHQNVVQDHKERQKTMIWFANLGQENTPCWCGG